MRSLIASALCLLASCVSAGDAFTLESSSFKNGAAIPVKYAFDGVKGGGNASPALSWRNPPKGTKSFVLSCVDKHPDARNWVHWLVFDIHSSCRSLPEDASLDKMPKGSVEFINSFRAYGWGGPMPPPGSGPHKYVFTLYALDVENPGSLISNRGPSEAETLRLLKGRILGEASIVGTFER
jgi:hypothetical protein